MKTSPFYVIIQVKMRKREAFAGIFTPYFNKNAFFIKKREHFMPRNKNFIFLHFNVIM